MSDLSANAVLKYKDYITNVLYLLVDAKGGTLESIALQTNGAVLVPRVGEEIEVRDRTNARHFAGTVKRVKHTGDLMTHPANIFSAEVAIYVE